MVCPKCDAEFQHNRVNGMALLELANAVEARTRMHSRLTLDALEKEFEGKELPRAVKKAVLDGYNDLARSVLIVLGLGGDAE